MTKQERLEALQVRYPTATMADIDELDRDSLREPEAHWDDKAEGLA